MKIVYFTIGIPRSGKSSWAKARCSEGSVRINKDDIRSMLTGGNSYRVSENLVNRMVMSGFRAAMSDTKITTIFLDNTHLNERHANQIIKIIRQEFDDIETTTYAVVFNSSYHPSECKRRNAIGPEKERVPESVIDVMFKQFQEKADVIAGYFDKIIRIPYDSETMEKR